MFDRNAAEAAIRIDVHCTEYKIYILELYCYTHEHLFSLKINENENETVTLVDHC